MAEQSAGRARRPVSTYRLQISADLDLHQAADVLDYLHDLGADWVYLSPLLAAEPGSTHGYDVVAHDHLDPERGGEEGLARLAERAHVLGMGVLVDIVPNHVGVATPSEDPWWWEVLREGPDAEHAHVFDIDWTAGDRRLRIPVVGDDDLAHDGSVRNLSLVEVEQGLELHYWDQAFPVAAGTASGPGDDPQEVHARQHYELAGWRSADDSLNYRRFFAVNTLAAVRVEEPEVFIETHVEIARWFDEGLVDGLRVDHPDGLRDPAGYLRDLAELTDDAYVLIEKILEPGERLPETWATAGTTGYDVLALLDRVLTDPDGEAPLTALDARLRGLPEGEAFDYPALVHDLKREVADGILNSEVRRIVRDLRRHLPTLPAFRAEDAVAELLACFPVYRSYLPEGVEHLDQAFAAARERRPDLAVTFDVLDPWLHDADLAAAKRFQQTSGMVMAKGVEDCAFYRYPRLTSLNEVGADPAVFAHDADHLHAALDERQRLWPHAMTTTSTHDTKRGEDVRARLAVLAEVPEQWRQTLTTLLDAVPVTDPVFANLLWQAIVGAWSDDPELRERLHGYAEKAMREAGDHTTWTEPDQAYEASMHAVVDAAFDDPVAARAVAAFVEVIDPAGRWNSLALKLLALTVPGVPDVYQGSEAGEWSLVDPDNRRPVDFAALAALASSGASPKLALTRTALRLRRDRPELFDAYRPIAVQGAQARHLIAFDRGGAITVVARFPHALLALADDVRWNGTTLDLPPGQWRDTLSDRVVEGGAVAVAEVLGDGPVALLVEEGR